MLNNSDLPMCFYSKYEQKGIKLSLTHLYLNIYVNYTYSNSSNMKFQQSSKSKLH